MSACRYRTGALAPPITVGLVRKTVPVYRSKTQQARYQRPFTKHEYLQQLLRVALPGWLQPQADYRYLLADSWYASVMNMNLVRALDHHFLFAFEISRTVALSEADRAQGQSQAVQSRVFPDRQPLRVYLRAVPQAVLARRISTVRLGCFSTWLAPGQRPRHKTTKRGRVECS